MILFSRTFMIGRLFIKRNIHKKHYNQKECIHYIYIVCNCSKIHKFYRVLNSFARIKVRITISNLKVNSKRFKVAICVSINTAVKIPAEKFTNKSDNILNQSLSNFNILSDYSIQEIYASF